MREPSQHRDSLYTGNGSDPPLLAKQLEQSVTRSQTADGQPVQEGLKHTLMCFVLQSDWLCVVVTHAKNPSVLYALCMQLLCRMKESTQSLQKKLSQEKNEQQKGRDQHILSTYQVLTRSL